MARVKPTLAEIKKIVIHCSDSPDTLDIGVGEIRTWHVKDRGWSDIGYHYVIRLDGTIEIGRPHNGDSILEGKEIGAHVKGENSDSLAICWVGCDTIRRKQVASLQVLTLYLLSIHKLKVTDVYGHYEFDPRKTCPNIDMAAFRETLHKLDCTLKYLQTI